MALTPDQIMTKLQGAIPRIAQILRDGELLACKDMEGALKYRIFNKGQNTAGGQIGAKYSTGYAAKRRRAGRQTGYVDLQFSGKLFESITTGERGGDSAVGIVNSPGTKIADNNTLKAETLEEKYDQEIFRPGQKEVRDAVKVMKIFVIDEIRKLLRQ